MSWTKRQLINKAFSRLGLASYTFDMNDEQWDDALTTLDSMMATWNRKGIRINYPFSTSPENTDLDQETDVPIDAAEAIFTNLSVNLASDYGKVPAPTLLAKAKETYNALLIRAAQPKEMVYPTTLPAGSGNKPWVIDSPYVQSEQPNIIQSPDENPEFLP